MSAKRKGFGVVIYWCGFLFGKTKGPSTKHKRAEEFFLLAKWLQIRISMVGASTQAKREKRQETGIEIRDSMMSLYI